MPVYRNIHTKELRVIVGNLIGSFEQAPNWERLPDPELKPLAKPKAPGTGGVVHVKPGATAVVGEGGHPETSAGAKKK